jgi:L-fuculose-phosphate aldolase
MQNSGIQLTPVGVLHCGLRDRSRVPRNYDISDITGEIEIFPAYLDAMADIRPGQTIVVLYWFDRADRSALKVYPRGDRSRGLTGVFSTRSPMRPNPIAVSEVEVLEVEPGRIGIKGVDALDGTPVLDIKKKV